MADLFLNSLEISQFRAFDHLRIERLGRVNLITGQNNVGKTCLLEALWLYTQGGVPYQLIELLEIRDELRERPTAISPATRIQDENPALNIRYLFHGRKQIEELVAPISIGPIDSESKVLTIAVYWKDKQVSEEVGHLASLAQSVLKENKIPYIRTRKLVEITYPLDMLLDVGIRRAILPEAIPCTFVTAQGLQTAEVGQLWDKVALTSQEEDVYNALRIIAPDVQRVSFVESADGEARGGRRIPIVKIKGLAEPIPLRSLGEGMNRLFGMALALVSAKDGVLLVDEVESGLHYSVLPDVWRLILQAAQRLNVQVFATTHSWDCITAFQQAAQEEEHTEGMLIRLEGKQGKFGATLFDERRLSIAAREQIEVR